MSLTPEDIVQVHIWKVADSNKWVWKIDLKNGRQLFSKTHNTSKIKGEFDTQEEANLDLAKFIAVFANSPATKQQDEYKIDVNKAILFLREAANHLEEPNISKTFILARVACVIAFLVDSLVIDKKQD